MKYLGAIALLLISTIALSQDVASVALKQISDAPVFAFGGIGFAGRTSEGEKDFRKIMSLPPAEASAAFHKLYESDNAQAKSYALVGMYKLDRSGFDELQKSIRNSSLKVRIMQGCILSQEPLSAVAAGISAGRYNGWIK